MVIGRFGVLIGCITNNILVGPPLIQCSTLLLYLQIERLCHLIDRIVSRGGITSLGTHRHGNDSGSNIFSLGFLIKSIHQKSHYQIVNTATPYLPKMQRYATFLII